MNLKSWLQNTTNSIRRLLQGGSVDLLRIRVFYLTFVGGSAFITPFFSLFYKSLGLTGVEIGTLGTISAICTMIAAPFWARLTKKKIQVKAAIAIGVVVSAITVILIGRQTGFGGLSVILAARSLLVAGVSPLTITLILSILKSNPKTGFGSVRVWASIGWAITSLVAGYFIEKNSFASGFTIAAIILGSSLLWLIPIKEPEKEAAPVESAQGSGKRSLASLFGARNRPILLLAAGLGITWISRNGIMAFQSIYMTQLGGGEAMVGIMNMLGAVVEIPGMFWADSLSKKYSPVQLLMAAFVIHAVAFLGVILFPSVESILVAQALNGLVLSLTVVSEIRFIQLNTEESRTAETIALITITLPAIVSIIFSPISGAIFDARGASVFYLIGLIGHLLAVVMLMATLNGSTKRKSVSAATGDGDQED